jgi:hypothetical protein
MTDDKVTPHFPANPGGKLAQAVLNETDHDKILELAQQLCNALDEQLLRAGKRPNTGNA